MVDVELTAKEWKRVLGWYSAMFKKQKPIEADEKLFRKIQIIHDAEKDFEDTITEED